MVADKGVKTCGRPPGRRKTAKIEIAIEPEIKDRFMDICYKEGRNASAELYQYIRRFIKEHKEDTK